jgi:NADH:ubiquinone oxidoreductase subunit H
MPQLNSVNFVHVVFWLLFFLFVFYIFMYLYYLNYFVLNSKIYLNFLYKKTMFIKCFFKGLTVSPPVFIFTYYIALVGVTLVPLLITIAFFTLAERKIIAAIQRRKGPNVVGFLGILQPFADGLKLVLKEILFPMKSNIGIFLAAPLITLILSFLGWSIISFSEFDLIGELNLSLLVLFAISSLSVYGLILAGWSKQL